MFSPHPHRGAAHHPPFAHSLQRLQVELVIGLDRHKRIVRRVTASAQASASM
jgi:hypothetical protein